MSWEEENRWESKWWGTCVNTLEEELKQIVYFDKMGFKAYTDDKSPYNYNMEGRSVVDIGGGAVSILLKCTNFKMATVIDPCDYPQWIQERYKIAGIEYIKQKAEDMDITKEYDLAIMYNVLQHSDNPEKIVRNALKVSKEFRVFEWVNTLISAGHPHSFTENQLNAWLMGMGKTEEITGETKFLGKCYYGIFKGDRYSEEEI